jgi:hypothetical protein
MIIFYSYIAPTYGDLIPGSGGYQDCLYGRRNSRARDAVPIPGTPQFFALQRTVVH